jgi:hypothetical protein
MEIRSTAAYPNTSPGPREEIASLARHPAVRALVASGADDSALQSLVRRLNGLTLTPVELGRLERAARTGPAAKPIPASGPVRGHGFVAYA